MIYIVMIIGYLLGSVPTSVLISKFILHDDIRNHGSGNPGSSNMIRTFGVRLGLLVLVLDILKGLLSALIGRWMVGEMGPYYGALAAVLGHNWSVFLRFNGGKGVATTVGACLILMPYGTLAGIVIFILVLFSSKYFSLGSLCCLATIWLSILVFQLADTPLFMTSTLLSLLAVYRHSDNIKRLRAGTENQMNL